MAATSLDLLTRTSRPVVVFDDERRVVAANDAAGALVGLPGAALHGRSVDEFVVSPDPGERRRDLDRMLTDGGAEGRRVLRRADGEQVRVRIWGVGTVTPGHHLLFLSPDERPVPLRPLSPRELEVVRRLALGESGTDVAAALVLSPATVRTHIQHAMGKLGAHTRAHLIALACGQGLVH